MSLEPGITIIKIGTASIINQDYELNITLMASIARQIEDFSSQHKQHKFILVSSGAIACGKMQLQNPTIQTTLPCKQMLSAIGQYKMMESWQKVFQKLIPSQHLITQNSLSYKNNREDFINCLHECLRHNTIPIINENDAISTEEINHKFTDNDHLTASLALTIKASRVIFITEADGLYTDNPSQNPKAQKLTIVKNINDSILQLANGSSQLGSGGMKSKLEQIQLLIKHKIPVWIIGKKNYDFLNQIEINQSVGTRFEIPNQK